MNLSPYNNYPSSYAPAPEFHKRSHKTSYTVTDPSGAKTKISKRVTTTRTHHRRSSHQNGDNPSAYPRSPPSAIMPTSPPPWSLSPPPSAGGGRLVPHHRRIANSDQMSVVSSNYGSAYSGSLSQYPAPPPSIMVSNAPLAIAPPTSPGAVIPYQPGLGLVPSPQPVIPSAMYLAPPPISPGPVIPPGPYPMASNMNFVVPPNTELRCREYSLRNLPPHECDCDSSRFSYVRDDGSVYGSEDFDDDSRSMMSSGSGAPSTMSKASSLTRLFKDKLGLGN